MTPAQANVALLVAAGLRDDDIAERLGIAPATVRTQLSAIYRDLGLTKQRYNRRVMLTRMVLKGEVPA
jgi:DNA-binding NarL/FixJ family response regulator